MKKIAALMGLGLMLSACSTTFQTTTYDLIVAVSGVTTATVQVQDVTKGSELFNGPVTGTKTISGVAAGDTIRITGAALQGYSVSAAQDIILNKNQTVTVTYTAQ